MSEERKEAANEITEALGQESDLLSSTINELFATDEEREMAARIGAKVLPMLAAQANTQAEKNKAAELKKVIDQLIEDNKSLLNAKIEEFRKAATPPSPDEIQKVLDQEYLEFNVHLRNGTGDKTFSIRELSMAAETKLLKVVSKTLAERMQDFARVNWQQAMDGDMLTRIQHLIQVVPGTMDTLAECCAVCLDPFGEQGITAEWVSKNIGLARVCAILDAQVKVSRYRDFFSLVGRFMPGQMTV